MGDWQARDESITSLADVSVTARAYLRANAFDAIAPIQSIVRLRVRGEMSGHRGYYDVPIVTSLSASLQNMTCGNGTFGASAYRSSRYTASPRTDFATGGCGAAHVLTTRLSDGVSTSGLGWGVTSTTRGGYEDNISGLGTWGRDVTLWFREGP
jgi:hypothetical protein